MKQEKVILSFVMVLIGLLVAGVAFYFYESSKTVTPSKEISVNEPTPTPIQNSSLFLVVSEPKADSIADRKTITVSGKTDPTATIAILTTSLQEIIKPSSQGDFNTTISIDNGLNYIRIQAIAPNGQTVTVQRTVGFTTEDF